MVRLPVRKVRYSTSEICETARSVETCLNLHSTCLAIPLLTIRPEDSNSHSTRDFKPLAPKPKGGSFYGPPFFYCFSAQYDRREEYRSPSFPAFFAEWQCPRASRFRRSSNRDQNPSNCPPPR